MCIIEKPEVGERGESMKNVVTRLGNLITVKSIVTLILTIVFAVLSIRGTITADNLISVFMIVIGFYFGTQKKDDTGAGAE